MKTATKRYGTLPLSLLLIVSMVLPWYSTSVSFGAEGAGTKIKHKAIKYFVPGHRIEVKATFKDDAGVELGRVYFRAQGQADYVFVDMEKTGTVSEYRGILPAPSDTTEAIEYLLLVVNGSQAVVRSQVFVARREEGKKVPAWQQVSKEGDILVKTELAEAPEELAGFTDSISMDVVESAARFGMVAAGIYTVEQIAGAGGAAAGATSGGTVAAGAGGISTTALVIGGVAVAGGGIAAAASGGGGHGGGGGGTGVAIDSPVVGKWVYNAGAGGNFTAASLEFTRDGTAVFQDTERITYHDGSSTSLSVSASGTYSVSGSSVAGRVSGSYQAAEDGYSGSGSISLEFSGSFSGNSMNLNLSATASGVLGEHGGGTGSLVFTRQ